MSRLYHDLGGHVAVYRHPGALDLHDHISADPVDPAGEDADAGLTLEQAAQRALELTGEGFGPTAAAKAAAQGTPYSKSEVYKQLLVLQQDRQTAE